MDDIPAYCVPALAAPAAVTFREPLLCTNRLRRYKVRYLRRAKGTTPRRTEACGWWPACTWLNRQGRSLTFSDNWFQTFRLRLSAVWPIYCCFATHMCTLYAIYLHLSMNDWMLGGEPLCSMCAERLEVEREVDNSRQTFRSITFRITDALNASSSKLAVSFRTQKGKLYRTKRINLSTGFRNRIKYLKLPTLQVCRSIWLKVVSICAV